MPITEQIEVRTYGDSTTIYPMPFLTNENMLYYQSAYRIDMLDLIDMVAIIQGHIDQGISTTLFVTDDKTTRDIARYYIYAHKKSSTKSRTFIYGNYGRNPRKELFINIYNIINSAGNRRDI